MGSLRELASWEVEYQDGGGLSQYDAEGNEVPYRAIDWPRVSRLILESQAVRRMFEVHPTPELHLSLRSRHFMTADGTGTMCFVLLGSQPGREIDAESTRWALYWFPDDTLHECPRFDCSDVRQYGSNLVHGQPRHLMPQGHDVEVAADTVVIE